MKSTKTIKYHKAKITITPLKNGYGVQSVYRDTLIRVEITDDAVYNHCDSDNVGLARWARRIIYNTVRNEWEKLR